MCWPVATEMVVLLVPSIIGINIDPHVSGSVAMISFEEKRISERHGFPEIHLHTDPMPNLRS